MAILLINPIGFIGGGWDDWQYLNAARCWVENGPCLPRTHWEGRWPVFVPLAGIIAVFGESRLTLSIWPLIASAVAIVLLAMVGNRAFGRPIGFLAAIIFVVTPAFSAQLLDPRPESIELALVLAGAYCLLAWRDERRPTYAALVGFCFALAFQVRETSIVAALFAGLYVLRLRPRLVDLAYAAVGFLAPLAIEFLTYWQITGDALFRRNLSLSHTKILSSELMGPIDHEGSPFFNKNYIANWHHEPGLHVHWLIDGLLNLLVDAKAGMTLSLTPALWLVFRKRLNAPTRTTTAALYGFAIAYASVLIYVFAMDPKARVMLVPLTASSLAFALLAVRIRQLQPTLIPAAMVAGQLILGAFLLFAHQRTFIAEEPAAEWIARYPGQIETDPNTRRHLELVPDIRRVNDLESNSAYLLYSSIAPCSRWPRRAHLPANSLEVIAEQPLSQLRSLSREGTGALCLYRYRRPMGADEVRAAIRRSRRDGEYILDPRNYLGTSAVESKLR